MAERKRKRPDRRRSATASGVTKLTAERQRLVCELIRDGGVPYVVACQKAGVHASTAWDWRNRGQGLVPDQPAVEPYVSFVKAVDEAEADAEIQKVLLMQQAAMGGRERVETRTERTYVVTVVDGVEHKQLTGEKTYTVRHQEPQIWTATAWWLERMHPERWGRKDRLEVTGAVLNNIVELPAELSDGEEWAVEAAKAMARRAVAMSGAGEQK